MIIISLFLSNIYISQTATSTEKAASYAPEGASRVKKERDKEEKRKREIRGKRERQREKEKERKKEKEIKRE